MILFNNVMHTRYVLHVPSALLNMVSKLFNNVFGNSPYLPLVIPRQVDWSINPLVVGIYITLLGVDFINNKLLTWYLLERHRMKLFQRHSTDYYFKRSQYSHLKYYVSFELLY